jgi:3-deoxy-D-manno-octulosonic-acid transferase
LSPARRSPIALFLLHALYDGLFLLFLLLSLPWSVVRLMRDRGVRESLPGRFGRGPRREGTRRCVWVHGVSVGELKAARLLVERLAAARADVDIVVSSTTSAGFALARRLFPDRLVIQFPLDLGFIMRRVLDRVRPDLIVLVELEIWPNLLREAHRRGVPVVIVNGRLSARSFNGYKLLSQLLPQFELIARYAVQNEEYAGRLRVLGVPESQIQVTGNLKYDTLRTELSPDQLEKARAELGLGRGEPLLVAGSTHDGEEAELLALLPELEKVAPGLRLLLAPRHVERTADVVRAVERSGRAAAQLTRLRTQRKGAPRGAVVVADTIGELETFYGIADVAFVGGSLIRKGGHNMLEPAALGKPTLFGPSTENFADEVRLLCGAGGGVQVGDAAALGREVERLLADPAAAHALGERGRAAVASARGGTERCLELALSMLDRPARAG